MIEKFKLKIPQRLLQRSGSVFYSGRTAFSSPSKLYILGLNPGGCPVRQARETVDWHTREVLGNRPAEWSEYRDASWKGRPPGTRGLQPRVLHVLNQLHLEARRVPSSNLIFLRSSRENTLSEDSEKLALECWPFHQSVIEDLRVRVILCFGKRAGSFVARQLNAECQVREFVEQNDRRWSTLVRKNRYGLKVVIATHPSIADWTAPPTDPSALIKEVISESE